MIILKVLDSERGKCASIAVDNAGLIMARSVVELLRQKLVLYGIIVTRDPEHCLDLGPKDLAVEPTFLKPILENSIKLIKLVQNDRVGGIKKKLCDEGIITSTAATLHPDTRMYLVSETLKSAVGQKAFLQILGTRGE